MDYKESHVFPSGIEVSYESDTVEQYFRELKAVSNQKELDSFIDRWVYLEPRISAAVAFDEFKNVIGNPEKQNEYIPLLEKKDLKAISLFSVIAPMNILTYGALAKKYVVPSGTIILQLWNGGNIKEDEDGVWRIHKKT